MTKAQSEDKERKATYLQPAHQCLVVLKIQLDGCHIYKSVCLWVRPTNYLFCLFFSLVSHCASDDGELLSRFLSPSVPPDEVETAGRPRKFPEANRRSQRDHESDMKESQNVIILYKLFRLPKLPHENGSAQFNPVFPFSRLRRPSVSVSSTVSIARVRGAFPIQKDTRWSHGYPGTAAPHLESWPLL